VNRTTPLDSVAHDVPAKASRPPAYDIRLERYQWHFAAIPRFIRAAGRTIPNPFRERAVFVVHGIGAQAMAETAAALRLGLEDALVKADPRHWAAEGTENWIVPQPYIADGYWGDYDEIARMESERWARMTENERTFFNVVWGHRAVSTWSTYWWFLKTSSRLLGRSRGLAFVFYLDLVPKLQVAVTLALLLSPLRQFARDYLNDARLYLEPRGDVEHMIVQRIEYLVGAKFLELLGLDWDLRRLPENRRLSISGESHEFSRVTWIAHSLGTVISYNVLGDILRRCQQVDPGDAERLRNAHSVLESLEGFVTLGSPLDKIRVLFPDVLREWPAEYLPGGSRTLWARSGRARSFWQNFHYTSDPVSSELDGFTHEGRNIVENCHPQGVQVPGYSHLQYWRDPAVLARLLSLTFGEYVSTAPVATRSRFRRRVSLIVGGVFWMLLELLALPVLLGLLTLRAAARLVWNLLG
jgi:hypothetical protein